MNNKNTHYPVRYNRSHEAILELYGDLTSKCAADIEADFFTVKSSGASKLIFDFSKVKYINSTGIAVLLRLIQLSRSENIELQAIGLSDHYQELFDITKLTDYIRILK